MSRRLKAFALDLGLVPEETIAEARVEQRVVRDLELLLLDLLAHEVRDLLGPDLRRDVVEVDRAVEARLRAELHAGVDLVHARALVGDDARELLRRCSPSCPAGRRLSV